MKDSIKKRKKLLALCLSAMMLASVGAIAACKDDEDSTDSSSSSSSSVSNEVKDEGLIKNAGFSTFDDENAINTSVTGWTRSSTSLVGSSALSSKAASGIIDLDTEAWNNLTGSAVDVNALTEETAKAQWDSLTVKDKLAYYDLWKEQNKDKKIAEDLDFYESMNIDSGDIPTLAAFDTHDGAVASNKDAAEADKKDTKVLMIHNEYPEAGSSSTYKALGTGQQYTSSSTVTVKAGTSAKFSVWVKTADLKCSATDGSVQEAVDKGAFISVTHAVGGKSMDAYKVENINTEGVTENNGWKQFSFYLKGSAYTDTTFNLVLGLGQGSMTYRGEYVNGYAFFDDIECEIITNDEYTAWKDENPDLAVTKFEDEGNDKIVNYYKTKKDLFALDFYGTISKSADSFFNTLTIAATETDGFTSVSGSNPGWLDPAKDASRDVAQVFAKATDIRDGVSVSEEAKKAELSKLYANYFEGDAAFATDETLLLMSLDGAAYTAKTATDAFKFSSFKEGTERKDYVAISFFVKTSAMEGFTGAGVTLVDGKNKTSFTSIDTSAMEGVTINDEKLYGDWQQYFFFVENAAEDDEKENTTFGLEFTFGPTSIEEANKDGFFPGFAAFTGFEVLYLSKAQYESVQSGANAKVVAVGAEEDKGTDGTPFDSAKGTPSSAIKEGLANPQNYKGVYFDSKYITGEGSTEINTNADAGLISKEYFTEKDGYFETEIKNYNDSGAWQTETATTKATPNWLKAIAGDPATATAEGVWKSVFDNSTQPLFIYNEEDNSAKPAYGFIGNSTELAANTYTAVSLRVRGASATANANLKAYVRLVDTNADNYTELKAYNQSLSIGGARTYWYNDDANICTGDPEKKATQVAFRLQPNGLYKANKSWDKYSELENKDAWFANLSAYTEKDENGNLLVAKGGAKHDYTDYWNNEGMNGIAFYADAEGNYYADAAKKVRVYDLASVSQLETRTDAVSADEHKLETEIDVTGEWTTVTFYIHTGDKAKNYRLEVWSGDKNGKGNVAKSYLVVDYNNVGTAESNFTSLMEEYKDKDEAVKFESVFSYFDSASFLRYNVELDENEIGNLYEDNYTPSAQTQGIAFLKYEESNYMTIFADYQYSEKTVAAAPVEEETEEEDSSSEEESDTNIWLLASSLAVAGVLILAIVSIVIRKVAIKARKNRAANGGKKKAKKSKNKK